MAIKSTIYKANLSIADIDHAYYADHPMTLARHPSETDERMMVRLAALALNAHKLQTVCKGDGILAFGAGLSAVEEPDVWLRDFTDECKLWIEVGQPEEKPILRACGKSDEVHIYTFHHSSSIWWKAIENKVIRAQNLRVYHFSNEATQTLARMAQRSMQLQATIQEGQLMLSDSQTTVEIEPLVWK